MTDLQDAQLEQIRAETAKAYKETEKLVAEIKNLQNRKPYNWHSFNWWRDLLGIFVVAASLVYGVVNFIDQQRAKNKFQVTKEVVTMVQELSEGSVQARGNIAILLAAYGEQVLPILFNALTMSDSPGLLTALSLIAQNDAKSVRQPLNKRAASDIGKVLQGEAHKIRAFKNYIKALGELGSLGDPASTIKEFKRFNETLDCEHLQEPGDFTLDILDRRAICEEIANACQKIGPEACKN